MGPIHIVYHPDTTLQNLVNSIAQNVFARCQLVELNDLRSIGLLAVIEQASAGNLVTQKRIRGAMLDAIRKEYRHASRRGEMPAEIPGPSRSYELADLLSHLPENCSRLVQLRLQGHARKDAARRLGLTVARARALEAAAIERLRALSKSRFKRAA